MIAQQDSIAGLVQNLPVKNCRKILTAYSTGLGGALITKYNDDYVKDENGKIDEVGDPDKWKVEINQVYLDKFKILEWNKSDRQKDLPY